MLLLFVCKYHILVVVIVEGAFYQYFTDQIAKSGFCQKMYDTIVQSAFYHNIPHAPRVKKALNPSKHAGFTHFHTTT